MPSDASAPCPDRVLSGTQAALGARLQTRDDKAAESQRANVLIVEDDPRSARLASAHLQSAGYRVSIAHTAAEAQQSVERAMPDLILCDVCLPDMDGIRLTNWMRNRFSGANLPIALITSSDDRMILFRGLEAGADDFLAKPVNSLELRGRVRSLLRSKVLADELRAREQVALPFGRAEYPAGVPSTQATERAEAPLAIVIEDNPAERRLLEAQLMELGCRTVGATSAAEGLRMICSETPDLIVLDLLLPDRSGYEFLASLGDSRPARTPVLVVSAMSEVQDRVKALELGADDYIIKGFERSEFEARVRRLLRLKRSLDNLQARCNQALQLAATDSLTGLYTYGFMQEMLRTQLATAERFGQPYSVILGDVDHFKQINDRFGHATGDLVLRKIAQALMEVVRPTDTLVRYGGEEFVALLPHTAGDDAMALARRMRDTVAGLSIEIEGSPPLQVSMSLGVAAYPEDACDPESLLQGSDTAMYLAKKSGRNRVAKISENTAREVGTARILVVDDDERNIRLLEAYLVPEGYQVLQARDGKEAIDVCQKQHPDVVIMDALMPNVCGFEACRFMKQDARLQFVPIMLVTSLTARDDHLRGIEAGADEFITKPIDKSQLLMRLQALLRQKRGTDLLEDAETVIFALARAVEGREPMLADHVERVANYAVALGRALELGDRDLEALRRAGIVHDIGKISVPDRILLKPDKLTSEERGIIERHPQTGHDLLKPLRTFTESLPAVRFHHERLDGSGYPLGLRGDEVPLLAQILAIADVYDALASPRHYRAALEPAEAFEILRDEVRRGLHDTKLVELFIKTISEAQGRSNAGDSDPAADAPCHEIAR